MSMIGNHSRIEWLSTGFKLAMLWLVCGLFLVFFWYPEPSFPNRKWIVIILFGPPLYVLGEWLMPRIWTYEPNDGNFGNLAAMRRVWRLSAVFMATCTFFALIYLCISWLTAKL